MAELPAADAPAPAAAVAVAVADAVVSAPEVDNSKDEVLTRFSFCTVPRPWHKQDRDMDVIQYLSKQGAIKPAGSAATMVLSAFLGKLPVAAAAEPCGLNEKVFATGMAKFIHNACHRGHDAVYEFLTDMAANPKAPLSLEQCMNHWFNNVSKTDREEIAAQLAANAQALALVRARKAAEEAALRAQEERMAQASAAEPASVPKSGGCQDQFQSQSKIFEANPMAIIIALTVLIIILLVAVWVLGSFAARARLTGRSESALGRLPLGEPNKLE